MSAADVDFAGSVPGLYDLHLRPMLFEPYAEDMAARAAATGARSILETAAGTGVVTAALAALLPDAELIATDLNQPMLDVAAARIASPRVRFRQADALALPFAGGTFDLLVCQFGLMFFPDRVAAFREARRVLRPGGVLLFSTWNRIEDNPVTRIAAAAVAALFPERPPDFFERVPFGYHDKARIAAELREAGFAAPDIETVAKRSRIGSACEAALGLCQGTPLGMEIEQRGPGRLDEATEAAAAALARVLGAGPIDAPMSAHVVRASPQAGVNQS
ncbi:MAG: SAM-dependent methyltransferase [Alphaproteobacteria bacterium]|nr:SAM-dependent methyltransferase [Alphaproteobacteria bacterium]